MINNILLQGQGFGSVVPTQVQGPQFNPGTKTTTKQYIAYFEAQDSESEDDNPQTPRLKHLQGDNGGGGGGNKRYAFWEKLRAIYSNGSKNICC